MSLIPYSTDGGQTSKYYLQVSGDSTLIPSTTTKLEIEFPAEFELAPNALTCTNKFGFSSNPTCSVVRQNVIEIQTSAMLFPFTTYLEIDVDPLKNPIVESGPFQIKLAAVRSPDPVPRHHADSQQHLQQRRLFYHASADHREDADLQGLRRLRLHRRLVQGPTRSTKTRKSSQRSRRSKERLLPPARRCRWPAWRTTTSTQVAELEQASAAARRSSAASRRYRSPTASPWSTLRRPTTSSSPSKTSSRRCRPGRG